MSNKDTLIIQCHIDKKYLPIVESISDTLFIAPIDKITMVEYYIDDDEFDQAEELLDEIEKEYGESVFTIRLRTRISRIQLLGV